MCQEFFPNNTVIRTPLFVFVTGNDLLGRYCFLRFGAFLERVAD